LSQPCKADDQVTFLCAKGHTCITRTKIVLDGAWCKICANESKKNSLDTIQEIALARGGKCLSTKYVYCEAMLSFQCGDGHVWEAAAINIMRGSWCRECVYSAFRKLRLAEVQARALARGGTCLATTYVNNSTPMQFRCAKGHVFEVSAHGLLDARSWCSICRRWSIITMQERAAERGGKCLSTEYIGASSRLLWECADGHQWQSTPASVYGAKAWCPICARGKRKARDKRKRSAEYLLFGKAPVSGS
jgi:hypothetical protein